MVSARDSGDDVSDVRVPSLERIASQGQVWAVVAERYGVTNPVPPWKSSLVGMCDALDSNAMVFLPIDRRRDEDLLSRVVYTDLPFPESQLVALAHSLVARGVIDEASLARRMEAVRARLEASA